MPFVGIYAQALLYSAKVVFYCYLNLCADGYLIDFATLCGLPADPRIGSGRNPGPVFNAA